MKTTLSFTIYGLIICFFLSINVFSQSLKKELEKAKQIRLLESTLEDVRKTLADFEHDDEDKDYYIQDFTNQNVEITVTFSLGADCDNARSNWKVVKGIATKINLTPTAPLKVKEFDFTDFKKETKDEEKPEDYFYHNENAGISFEIENGEIIEITLYPPKSKIGFLCENDLTENILSGKESYPNVVDSEAICILINQPANVTKLNLSAAEVNLSCNDKDKNCAARNLKIDVNTIAVDPENDTLIFNYTVSDGKILGNGANVIWDLSGVKAGTYTITAGVDDGCGVCGQTQTATVTVNECADCSEKPNR